MVAVRPAGADELATVLSILDAAALRTDSGRVERAIGDDDVLVATPADADRVLGALVLEGAEVRHVAVRPGRRGQGVGRALIEAASGRRDRLVATFDPDVAAFYDALGFDVAEPAGDKEGTHRLRGVLDP